MAKPSLAFVQSALGIGALCGMDAVVKHLALSHDVMFVTLARYISGTILALGVWWAAGRPSITRAMLPVQVGRGVLIAIMATLFYWSLTQLTLAEAITLSFIAPLLVPPMASLFLGERLQSRFVLAGLVGFGGVLVTIQAAPVFDGDRLLALAAVLGAAVFYAASLVLLRARAGSDGSTITTLFGALVPAILLSPLAIGQAMPDAGTIGWFVVLGLLGNIGIQLIARAYAAAEAQVLAVMEFTALPWAAVLGWLVFAEPVRPQVWAGGAIIALACLWSARGERAVAVACPPAA